MSEKFVPSGLNVGWLRTGLGVSAAVIALLFLLTEQRHKTSWAASSDSVNPEIALQLKLIAEAEGNGLSKKQINAELSKEPEVRLAEAYKQIITEWLRRYDALDSKKKTFFTSVSQSLFIEVLNKYLDEEQTIKLTDPDWSINSFLSDNNSKIKIDNLEGLIAYLGNMDVFATPEFERYFNQKLITYLQTKMGLTESECSDIVEMLSGHMNGSTEEFLD